MPTVTQRLLEIVNLSASVNTAIGEGCKDIAMERLNEIIEEAEIVKRVLEDEKNE